jgi:hypothetical protein
MEMNEDRAKKPRFIGVLKDFAKVDWKRRDFSQTATKRACVLECGGKQSATPLSNGVGFRKRKCPFDVVWCFKSGVTATPLQDRSALGAVRGKLMHIFWI